MGEGNDAESLKKLILYINEKYPNIKVGLYSGREMVDDDFFWDNLNYLKIGPYKEELGPLNKETTNQRLYRRTDGRTPDLVLVGGKWYAPWVDITDRFWRKKI
jgi:anaerobic ribonucleoside-triphosphate reductase activating protein